MHCVCFFVLITVKSTNQSDLVVIKIGICNTGLEIHWDTLESNGQFSFSLASKYLDQDFLWRLSAIVLPYLCRHGQHYMLLKQLGSALYHNIQNIFTVAWNSMNHIYAT